MKTEKSWLLDWGALNSPSSNLLDPIHEQASRVQSLFRHAEIQNRKEMTKSEVEAHQRLTAASTVPSLVCPNCLKIVTAIDCKNDYVMSDGTIIKPIPTAPIAVNLQPFFYTAEPCLCRVPSWWAANWTREMDRRLNGQSPRGLICMSQTERKLMDQRLTAQLSRLYQIEKDTAALAEQRQAAKIWSIIVADAITCLHPGEHNIVQPSFKSKAVQTDKTFETKLMGEWGPLDEGYGPEYPLPKKKDSNAVQPLSDVLQKTTTQPVSAVFERWNQAVAKKLSTPQYLANAGVTIDHVRAAWEVLARGCFTDAFQRALAVHNVKPSLDLIQETAQRIARHLHTGGSLDSTTMDYLIYFANECRQGPKPVAGPVPAPDPPEPVAKKGLVRRRRTIRHTEET